MTAAPIPAPNPWRRFAIASIVGLVCLVVASDVMADALRGSFLTPTLPASFYGLATFHVEWWYALLNLAAGIMILQAGIVAWMAGTLATFLALARFEERYRVPGDPRWP